MKNNLTKKIILSIALTMIGTATIQSPHSPISMSSNAKAYYIDQEETNVSELTKYYTQRHLTFSNKWLWQKENGTIHATLLQLSWFSHIQVFGPESWGNINQLRNKYVDIFALKDYETWHTYMLAQGTFIGEHPFYTGNKPVLTLKEVDFRIRQTLIKNKKLYHGNYNKGHIKITGGSNNYTIDLNKRLKSTDANRYVKNPQTAHIEILLEKSN
ncbi:exotoxin [Staphylococcus aureus]|nr:exotoxin beta-grasp domain-containing protein [Staphylococcus aureus]SAY99291.1 exotoxin [Staphylococcus aureus]